MAFREARSFNKLKLLNSFRPPSALLTLQCALPAAAPRLPTLRRVCHSCSAELPTHCLIKLQFRDRLCIRTHRGRPLSPASAARFAVWSNSSSGIASTASGAISCCAFASTGGDRAGAIASAVVTMPHSVAAAKSISSKPMPYSTISRQRSSVRMISELQRHPLVRITSASRMIGLAPTPTTFFAPWASAAARSSE